MSYFGMLQVKQHSKMGTCLPMRRKEIC